MPLTQPITLCLWFDKQAEEAATFYVSLFPNSRIVQLVRYGEAGQETHQQQPGSVMTVAFELNGQPFTALNGGPLFHFTEALSLQVICSDQAEIDHYWDALGKGGDPQAQQCGWLKDRYGISWQIIPSVLMELLQHPDPAVAARVTTRMLQMKKLEIAPLQAAAAG